MSLVVRLCLCDGSSKEFASHVQLANKISYLWWNKDRFNINGRPFCQGSLYFHLEMWVLLYFFSFHHWHQRLISGLLFKAKNTSNVDPANFSGSNATWKFKYTKFWYFQTVKKSGWQKYCLMLMMSDRYVYSTWSEYLTAIWVSKGIPGLNTSGCLPTKLTT